MKLKEHPVFSQIGKRLSKPLSLLVANPMALELSRSFEAYWSILLGKGAGTGWALDAEAKAAKATIRHPSPIIFDIGANNGEWSLLIHSMYPQARFFIFEPQPACQRFIENKNIPNSVLIPKAVASTVGESVKLYTEGDTSKIASIYPRRDSSFKERDYTLIDVDTVTVDHVVQEYGLTRIDFMKMDIEGHEIDALRGSTKSLESKLIKALSFEFGSSNINSRTFFHDFWDMLHPLGYKIYRVLPSSRLLLIKEYYEDCEYFRSVTNYVAVLPQ